MAAARAADWRSQGKPSRSRSVRRAPRGPAQMRQSGAARRSARRRRRRLARTSSQQYSRVRSLTGLSASPSGLGLRLSPQLEACRELGEEAIDEVRRGGGDGGRVDRDAGAGGEGAGITRDLARDGGRWVRAERVRETTE